MNISIITVGTRMPAWVNAGVNDYLRRLRHVAKIDLIEIPVAPRSKNADIQRLIAQEGDKMLAAIPTATWVFALDENGKTCDSQAFAQQLQSLRDEGQTLCILIGGPDGLDPRCLSRANTVWSLSKLTFPHTLVRVILLEQLYRGFSILQGLPYHRK